MGVGLWVARCVGVCAGGGVGVGVWVCVGVGVGVGVCVCVRVRVRVRVRARVRVRGRGRCCLNARRLLLVRPRAGALPRAGSAPCGPRAASILVLGIVF